MRLGSLMRAPAVAAGIAEMPGAGTNAVAPIGGGTALVPSGARPIVELRRSHLSLHTLSFLVLVVIPTAIAAAYYFAIAADQYVAEFRFTLNTADPPRFDPMSLLGGNTGQTPAAFESQVLAQYITSRAIIDEIDPALALRHLFAPPQADWWARLGPNAPIEEVVRYWKGQVDPFYDPANGGVTVRVRAFAPEDALRLAQAVVTASEKLVNDLSVRARRRGASCRDRGGAGRKPAQIGTR